MGRRAPFDQWRIDGRPEDAEVFGMEQRDPVITMSSWSMVNESELGYAQCVWRESDSVLSRINAAGGPGTAQGDRTKHLTRYMGFPWRTSLEEGLICHDSRTETSQYRTNVLFRWKRRNCQAFQATVDFCGRGKQYVSSMTEAIRIQLEVGKGAVKNKDVEESSSSQTFFRIASHSLFGIRSRKAIEFWERERWWESKKKIEVTRDEDENSALKSARSHHGWLRTAICFLGLRSHSECFETQHGESALKGLQKVVQQDSENYKSIILEPGTSPRSLTAATLSVRIEQNVQQVMHSANEVLIVWEHVTHLRQSPQERVTEAVPTPIPIRDTHPYACSANTITLILFTDMSAHPNSSIASRRVCSRRACGPSWTRSRRNSCRGTRRTALIQRERARARGHGRSRCSVRSSSLRLWDPGSGSFEIFGGREDGTPDWEEEEARVVFAK
ncbi:hypothetical protein B0H14DRAFT_3722576 [Mycena olivaceomarginata]|nr:hypothetical protein B0H14DRAFT_3722576 [Mycena olivaceomarginata]